VRLVAVLGRHREEQRPAHQRPIERGQRSSIAVASILRRASREHRLEQVGGARLERAGRRAPVV
jgi:hypothetical protein